MYGSLLEAIYVQIPLTSLRMKASRAPPAGGGGMYMRVFPSDTFQASSSRTWKLLKSSISKVPPKNGQETRSEFVFSFNHSSMWPLSGPASFTSLTKSCPILPVKNASAPCCATISMVSASWGNFRMSPWPRTVLFTLHNIWLAKQRNKHGR